MLFLGDIEKVLVDYFAKELPGIQVGTRIPIGAKTYLAITRNSGTTKINRVPILDQAYLTLRVAAETEQEAFTLTNTIREKLHALTGQTVDGITIAKIQEFSALVVSRDNENHLDTRTLNTAVWCRPLQ